VSYGRKYKMYLKVRYKLEVTLVRRFQNTLRKLLNATRSAKTAQKTLAAIATLSLHSMQFEIMVSHHNTIV